jgi:GT2 family glycosyltransferase
LLLDNPSADVVYGKTRVRNLLPGTKLRRYADGEAVYHPCFGSMLIRRSAFEKAGTINESFDHSEDVDWLCRANENGVVTLRTDFVVLEYRIHGGNMTDAVEENRAHLFRALKQSLDRRRTGK